MRKVAAYAMESTADSNESAAILEKKASKILDDWLKDKGRLAQDGETFALSRGREGVLSDTTEHSPSGSYRKISLSEASEGGRFVCEVSLTRKNDACAIFVELRVASQIQQLAPFQFDVRRPAFIQQILNSEEEWYLDQNLLPGRPVPFVGAQGGADLSRLIWHKDRTIPLILISTEKGKSITESFTERVCSDLCGLAIIGTSDETSSRMLSSIKGTEWSCYNGAVRLYWPVGPGMDKPSSHPIWTKSTLYTGVSEAKDASYRIRSQFRRQILGLSAFSIREPRSARELRSEINELRQHTLAESFKRGESEDDFREIAENYAADNDRLRAELAQRDERLNDLQDQVENLQVALRYVSAEAPTVAPDKTFLIDSVAAALRAAEAQFGNELEFSDSIYREVESLHPEAGPPDKIFRYLEALSDLAAALKSGSLGEGVIPWLENRGVTCSVESETTRRSRAQMKQRTWQFGGKPVEFDFHLKPSDNVSQDRCARIYFDLNGSADKVRVGYVGRHLD
ncbi:hypothetical protein J5226_03805 [Lysobacter sp. K5869]|uniref:hypothetical protein n=1 Tax=Lysobacter sp. K5869 TaxID=2820808 RepID=UPI001C061DE4|nr:hypothetical protein [Lysobacter sp. K5869]QWP77542.1 hypothetical protein J5226_03805 [Lysobacter sp. K5869]